MRREHIPHDYKVDLARVEWKADRVAAEVVDQRARVGLTVVLVVRRQRHERRLLDAAHGLHDVLAIGREVEVGARGAGGDDLSESFALVDETSLTASDADADAQAKGGKPSLEQLAAEGYGCAPVGLG